MSRFRFQAWGRMKEFRLADEVSGEELRERFTSEICRFLPTVPFFEAVGRGGGW